MAVLPIYVLQSRVFLNAKGISFALRTVGATCIKSHVLNVEIRTRASALARWLAGDANRVAELETQIEDAESTLNGLRTLE